MRVHGEFCGVRIVRFDPAARDVVAGAFLNEEEPPFALHSLGFDNSKQAAALQRDVREVFSNRHLGGDDRPRVLLSELF
ncbi:MAG TPA: hypothetical protein VJ755_10120 [Gemmatimonadales bacterium]|nr:hypothetical protein [Gemmatimonadales bacterium]